MHRGRDRRTQIGIAAAALGFLAALSAFAAPPAASGFWTVATNFTDDRGHPVHPSDFVGRRTVVTMAYAACRRTCSFTLKKLQSMQSQADERHERLEFVIVSFDPERDTPAEWARYRRHHGLERPNWHFLSGTRRSTRELADRIGIGDFWSYDDHVLHDFAAVVVDDQGHVERRLRWKDLAER